ncbi:pilus assembly protein TadG-related protein [Streptomyces sp. NPDC058052]|uniref:pilus assembly protein TadG-related protein n=1 Tax=Streptomyces sp. NPDC058052 TaxID=3346316 RepID=UPI0036E24E0F
MRCGGRESGQAFPAYVAVIAGLLFLAFVYFAVGQAAVLRNGAQTAADAAALGAAQDARDQLREGWLDAIADPTQWQQFVQGEGYEPERACQRAIGFAAANGAELLFEDCVPLEFGFTVAVQSKESVGESIVPDTAERRAKASASAVLEPLCTFNPSEPSPDPSMEPDPSNTPPAEPEEEEPEPISGLTCGGEAWEVDPEDPVLPGVDVLYRVRLAGDDE